MNEKQESGDRNQEKGKKLKIGLLLVWLSLAPLNLRFGFAESSISREFICRRHDLSAEGTERESVVPSRIKVKNGIVLR